jgi:hypothetical protein
MAKLNFTVVLIIFLVALVAYLLLHPFAAQWITDWLQRQFGLENQLPQPKSLPRLNYPSAVPVHEF